MHLSSGNTYGVQDCGAPSTSSAVEETFCPDVGYLSADWDPSTAIQCYKCGVCSESFAHQSSLKRHMKHVHSESDAKMFKCSICKKNYSRQDSLMRHYRYVHPGVAMENCNVLCLKCD